MQTQPSKISPIDRLLRGISASDVETVRDAWRTLLDQSTDAVDSVRAKLASPAWADAPRGPITQYLGVLLALLDELDPDAFCEEIERLQKAKLHPLHRKTVDIVSLRLKDAPLTHIAHGIPVYISDDIADKAVVAANLQRWSITKDLALEDVTRIDVIARNPQLDYLGLYNMFFSGIVLTWPAEKVSGLSLWYHRIDAEFTFYHEVGHHACGHIEGGSVAEQEKEANDYARAKMRKARPVFTAIGRAILFPLRPLLKRLIPRLD